MHNTGERAHKPLALIVRWTSNYSRFADAGRGPTFEKSHGSKPISAAGEPGRSQKSSLSGARNIGSATRLSLSCPAVCHSAKLIVPNKTGLPEAFQYRLLSKAHTSRPVRSRP